MPAPKRVEGEQGQPLAVPSLGPGAPAAVPARIRPSPSPFSVLFLQLSLYLVLEWTAARSARPVALFCGQSVLAILPPGHPEPPGTGQGNVSFDLSS